MKIDQLRKDIDRLDDEILNLLMTRLEVALEIGQIKKNEQLEIYDPNREKLILDQIEKKISIRIEGSQLSDNEAVLSQSVMDIYKDIFTMSKRIQSNKSKIGLSD